MHSYSTEYESAGVLCSKMHIIAAVGFNGEFCNVHGRSISGGFTAHLTAAIPIGWLVLIQLVVGLLDSHLSSAIIEYVLYSISQCAPYIYIYILCTVRSTVGMDLCVYAIRL